MTTARDAILANIRKNLKRSQLTAVQEKELELRMQNHSCGIIPKRSQLNHDKLVELFIHQAQKAAATIDCIDNLDGAPAVVYDLLKSEKLALSIGMVSDVRFSDIPWEYYPELVVRKDETRCQQAVNVTGCYCGIAETGTLAFLSGTKSLTQLKFLSEIHIVLLFSKQIMATYEAAWQCIRKESTMPRTVNFITGPSRSGDIEQTIMLGVHGPRRLHIIVCG